MGTCVDFQGTNAVYTAPEGASHRLYDVRAFTVKSLINPPRPPLIVTRWRFSDVEIADIIRSRDVYCAVQAAVFHPILLGSEASIREAVSDIGVWRK